MTYVFISYSKRNRDYAQAVKNDLLKHGFDVWIDDRLEDQIGDDWWAEIRKALYDCAAFLIIMTPESESSPWVGSELGHAIQYKKPIFPLLRAGSGNPYESDTWSKIVNIQFVDVRSGRLPPESLYTRLVGRGVPRRPITSGMDVTAPAPRNGAPPAGPSPAPSQPDPNPPPRRQVPAYLRGDEEILPDLANATRSIVGDPFDLCYVPAGRVTLEYDPANYKIFDVPAFFIAEYPITNAQFQVFMDARDGYSRTHWWSFSPQATNWRMSNPDPLMTGASGDELPRTNVPWYVAVAFCDWLTVRLASVSLPLPERKLPPPVQAGQGVKVSLPTEPQWQRAAQGDDGRLYPWGRDFKHTLCNTSESRHRRPTPVTAYPGGVSPMGVMDMAGNIAEWCLTHWGDGGSDLSGDLARVLRGGSWKEMAHHARCAARSADYPHNWYNHVGFRIVLTLPS